MLSTGQRQYLQHNASRDGRRWAYTEQDRDLIDELVLLGLLEAARGECIYEAPQTLEQVDVFGQRVFVRGRLISLYRLTRMGERAIRHRTIEASAS